MYFLTLVPYIAGSVSYRQTSRYGIRSEIRATQTLEMSKSKILTLKRQKPTEKRSSKEVVGIKLKKGIGYKDIIGRDTTRFEKKTLDELKMSRVLISKYLSKDDKLIDEQFKKSVKDSALLPEKLLSCLYVDIINVCIMFCESNNQGSLSKTKSKPNCQKPIRRHSIYGNNDIKAKPQVKSWLHGSLKRKNFEEKPRVVKSEPADSNIFDVLEQSAQLYIKACRVISTVVIKEECNFLLYNIVQSLPSFINFINSRAENEILDKIDWWFFRLNRGSPVNNEIVKIYDKVVDELQRKKMTIDLDYIQEIIEKESEELNCEIVIRIYKVKQEMIKEAENQKVKHCLNADGKADILRLSSIDSGFEDTTDGKKQREEIRNAQSEADKEYLHKELIFVDKFYNLMAKHKNVFRKEHKFSEVFVPDPSIAASTIVEAILELLRTRGTNKNLFNKYLEMVAENTVNTKNLMQALLETPYSESKSYGVDILIDNLIYAGSYLYKTIELQNLQVKDTDFDLPYYTKRFQTEYILALKSCFSQLSFLQDQNIKALCEQYINSYSDSIINFVSDPDYSQQLGSRNNIILCIIRSQYVLLYNFYTLKSLDQLSL